MAYPIRLGEDFTVKRKKRRKKVQVPKKTTGVRIFDDDIDVPPAGEDFVIQKDDSIPISEPETEDVTPPRKRRKLHQNQAKENTKDSDSDQSPVRPNRSRFDSDDEDMSPPRKTRMDSDEELSPPRKVRMDSDDEGNCEDSDSDQSPPRRLDSDSDQSPPRNKPEQKEDTTTSSMKIARREGAPIKKPKVEVDPEKEKQEKEQWAKGSVQIQQELENRMRFLEEIQKPFSRTRDDEDLEHDLREQDRFGDPMARYIKDKKKSKQPSKPKYAGPPGPPNRFNIPPGFRWDGVDRSNGFEKFWFTAQAARKLTKEEAYKWSTADM